MYKIIKSKKKTCALIVVIYALSLIVPNCSSAQVTDNLNNNNPAGSQKHVKVKDVMNKITLDTLDRIYKSDPCKAVDDSTIPTSTKQNISAQNFVPVTSDLMEDSLHRIETSLNYLRRYSKWTQNWIERKECDYDVTSSQMQAMFLAKLVRDSTAAIKNEIFAGNPAFIQNRNNFEQNIADDILKNVIYGDRGLENACSYNKEAIKVALNTTFASDNKGDINYMIGESVCSLDGDSSQHQALYDELTDSKSASWSDFKGMEDNPYSNFIKLERGIRKAIDNETRQANRSTKNGFMSLYECKSDSGYSDVLSHNGDPNLFYRVSNAGEDCKLISPAHVIERTYLDIMNASTGRVFDPGGGFEDVVPEMLKLNVAYQPTLDATDGLMGSDHEEVLGLSANAINDVSVYKDGSNISISYNVKTKYTSYAPPTPLNTIPQNDYMQWDIWKILGNVVKNAIKLKKAYDKIQNLSDCVSAYQINPNGNFDDTNAVNRIVDTLNETIKKQKAVNKEAANIGEIKTKLVLIETSLTTATGKAKEILEAEKKVLLEQAKKSNLKALQNDLDSHITNNINGSNSNSMQSLLDKCKAA